MADKYDNLYEHWSKTHSPEECTWRLIGEEKWEECCDQIDVDEGLSTHWRCIICKQGTGNQLWNFCPYRYELEHVVALALLEVSDGPRSQTEP